MFIPPSLLLACSYSSLVTHGPKVNCSPLVIEIRLPHPASKCCTLWNLLCLKCAMIIVALWRWLFIILCKKQRFVSSIQNFLLRRYIKNLCPSCFIRGSKDLKTIKALCLRHHAFICFSVFGTFDETLALTVNILLKR